MPCAAGPAADFLGKISVDQHAREVIGLLWIRYQDVVPREISVSDFPLGVQRLVGLDCIAERRRELAGSRTVSDIAKRQNRRFSNVPSLILR